MENYFGFALKKVAEDIMDILNGKLLFFTVVVLKNYGESLLIKFNLRTCFVFDRIVPTTLIDAIYSITFYYLKVKMNLFFII